MGKCAVDIRAGEEERGWLGWMLPPYLRVAVFTACVLQSAAARKMLFSRYFSQALDGKEKAHCSGMRFSGVVLVNNLS